MKAYVIPNMLAVLLIISSAIAMPYVQEYATDLQQVISDFKTFSTQHFWVGYGMYALLLSGVVLTGLPIATLAMLFAGGLYGFWEAISVILLARLAAAFIALTLVRSFFHETGQIHHNAPRWIRRFETHPQLGLLIVRLMPIPDSVVNYGTAASPLTKKEYLAISIMGMIPFTALCAWAGKELGTTSSLLNFL